MSDMHDIATVQPADEGPVARIVDLTVTRDVRGETQTLLERVSLRVDAGSILSIVGEPGSGKSMIAEACLGRLPRDLVLDGEVRICGRVHAGRTAETDSRHIAWLPGVARDALPPDRRVGAFLCDAIAARLTESDDVARDEVEAAIQAAGRRNPDRFFQSYPGELRTADLQRALLALAIAGAPRLVIADEPGSDLDVIERDEFLEQLRTLQTERGFALLLLTRDPEIALAMGGRVAVLTEGRIVETADAEALRAHPATAHARRLFDAPALGRGATGVTRPAGHLAPLIRVEDIAISGDIGGEPHAELKHIRFEVRRTGCLAILGGEKSGKSAIGLALLKLLPLRAGRIFFDAINLDGIHGDTLLRLRRRFAAVFPATMETLDPLMSVGDLVSAPLRAQRVFAHSEVGARVQETLKEVGLDDTWIKRRAATLTPEDRQRVAIACAIIAQPDALLLDEPTDGLEPAAQARLIDLLRQIKKKQDLACVLLTRDPALAERIADEVLVLHRGEIVERGPTQGVFAHPEHPYTEALVRAAKHRILGL